MRKLFGTDGVRGVANQDPMTSEMALRIEKAFGPDMDHLLRMQLAYDVARTRRHAGHIAIKRGAVAEPARRRGDGRPARQGVGGERR